MRQVISPQVLDWIVPDQFAIRERRFRVDCSRESVMAYRYSDYWIDVGIPQRYLQVHWDLLDGALGDA